MPTRANYSIEDNSAELASFSVALPDLTVANYAAVTADADELKTAVTLVIRGAIRDVQVNKSFPQGFGAVTDDEAQRESKWLVIYKDMQQWLDAGPVFTIPNPGYGKTFTVELPTAKLGGLIIEGTDLMQIASGDGLTFKNAFEANVRSPYNANSSAPGPHIRVERVVHVGRNL